MATEKRDGVTESCAPCQAAEAEKKPKFEYLKQNELSNVRRVVAVMSGKGGVGKSLVTSLLAVTFTRDGYQVGILDADVTGPSIPKSFGVKGRPEATEEHLYPVRSACGIRVISMNLFLDKEDEPIIWRGPVISGAIRQFWTDVAWGDLDYLFVDLPPGTGDVPLTVMQSLPLTGIIVVSSPQDLTVMVVRKAIKMAEIMGVPLLGLIENMAYIVCPHCGEKNYPFGEPKGKAVAEVTGLDLLATLPLDPKLARLVDAGEIEECDQTGLEHLPRVLEEKLAKKPLS